MDDRIRHLRMQHTRVPDHNADLTQPVGAKLDGLEVVLTPIESFEIPGREGQTIQIAIFRYTAKHVAERGLVAFWRQVQDNHSDAPLVLHPAIYVVDHPTDPSRFLAAFRPFQEYLTRTLGGQ